MPGRFKSWSSCALGIALLLGAVELAARARHLRRVPRTRANPGQVTLVALGDSIVAGSPGDPAAAWPACLAIRLRTSRFGVEWRVSNAGQPGGTAPQGYERFDRDVAVQAPQVVMIAFGLNDCNPARTIVDSSRESLVPQGLDRSHLWRAARVRLENWRYRSGWRFCGRLAQGIVPEPRTSPEGFANTLDVLVAGAKRVGAKPVLLTMTPLAREETQGVCARSKTYGMYNSIIRARAVKHALPLVELASGAPPAAWDRDGFHLTSVGQAWVADQVYGQLESIGFWAEVAKGAEHG